MKKWYRILMTLAILLLTAAVSAEDGFHSDFGWLPPEISDESGLLAGEIGNLMKKIDQEGLPPSHRQRRVYEWIMQSFSYDPDITFTAEDQENTEAVFLCVSETIRSEKTGDAGFALMAHYLLGKLGLNSVIISGELQLPDGSVQEHLWNYVFFSGKWYHFDPLAEMLVPELNGFMNVAKDLTGSALKWNEEIIPPSADYPVRALGCECDF